jgi:predicted membrane-bound spermidine synthase
VLCLLFFLSGTAALLFETLWFRLAALAFGNSVWASSLVLSSFMAGLALGNAWAARRPPSREGSVRLYARLELTIGLETTGPVAYTWGTLMAADESADGLAAGRQDEGRAA